jgi:membrane protein YdbS with pleckstrin-like domain
MCPTVHTHTHTHTHSLSLSPSLSLPLFHLLKSPYTTKKDEYIYLYICVCVCVCVCVCYVVENLSEYLTIEYKTEEDRIELGEGNLVMRIGAGWEVR